MAIDQGDRRVGAEAHPNGARRAAAPQVRGRNPRAGVHALPGELLGPRYAGLAGTSAAEHFII